MFKNKYSGSANTILVVLLVIAAFLVGSFYTRIQYLEKGTNGGSQGQGNAVANVTSAPPQAQPTISYNQVPSLSDSDHFRGNKDAKLVIIEYSDYECPFCKRFHVVMQQLIKDYDNKIKWVYRHYPLPFHANAFMESEAAECVAKYGNEENFWKFTDAIYEKTSSNGTSFTKEQLIEMTADLGIEQNKIKTCLDKNEMKGIVQKQMDTAQTAGISGTPGSFVININNKKVELVPGAYPVEEMKKIIDKLI